MKFIELFCGIGGFRYGIEKANKSSQCTWSNDIDKYACQIYRKQYGTGELFEGDIRTVDPLSIPEADLICGGFPCQAFSIAGKRRGFEDTRGTLFFEICRIARAKRIKYLFLENVKGLLNHNGGATFETIIRTLDELGYDCQWQVCNSKNYGVPQNRERVFIVCNLRTECRPQVFPIGETMRESNQDEEGENITGTVKDGWGKIQNDATYLRQIGQIGEKDNMAQRVYNPDGLATTLRGQGGGQGAKTGLYKIHNMLPRNSKSGKGGTGHLTRDDGNTYCLDTGNTNAIEMNSNVRRLTPVEAERLQGFPDNWTSKGIDKNGKEVLISDSQRYKCLGNAVTTNVIMEIGKILKEAE